MEIRNTTPLVAGMSVQFDKEAAEQLVVAGVELSDDRRQILDRLAVQRTARALSAQLDDDQEAEDYRNQAQSQLTAKVTHGGYGVVDGAGETCAT